MRQNGAGKQEARDVGKRLKRSRQMGEEGWERGGGVHRHEQGWGHGQEGGC